MPTIPIASVDQLSTWGDDVRLVRWNGLANDDDGAKFEMPGWSDRSVQVVGTFGVGGNLRVEGSNEGTNWSTLSDPQGVDLNFTTMDIAAVLEIVRYIRPRVTGGDATTNLSVIMIVRR